MRYIFTGTPGSGKTSVLNAICTLGYTVIEEAATDVILLEQQKGNAKPWEGICFIDAIVNMQQERQQKALAALQFYDRSPFCTYALAHYLNFKVSSLLQDEIDRCISEKIYDKNVFFFENLGSIEKTQSRTISYEEALIFEDIHRTVYKNFGFNIIMIQKKSIKERAIDILNMITA